MDVPRRPVLFVFVWFCCCLLFLFYCLVLKGNRGEVDVGKREGAGRNWEK